MEQRKITFRGKSKETDEWIYGDLIQWTNQNRCAITPQDGDQWDNPNDYEVEPSTVGQHTGFKEKNQVEVYDQDFLKGYFNEVLLVEWSDADFQWFLTRWDTELDENDVLIPVKIWVPLAEIISRVGNELYVCGNSFQNPELLNP